MGGGGLLGGLWDGIFGDGGRGAQEEAMKRQAEAQERAAKIQEQQAAANAARQEQATNKANADIADAAAAAIDKTPTVTNSSNLTGSLGVPELNTAGGATLGSSLLSDLMDDELKKKS